MEEMEARRIVDSYADMILRISLGYVKSLSEAQDVCQTVFLKYLTSGKEFDSLQDEKAWIIRVTINECKNILKSAFSRKTVGLEEVGDIKDETATDMGIIEVVDKLPRNYRLCIYLYYYEGYSQKEIADFLGKSESVIAAYLSRGRKKLKKMIKEEYKEICNEWKYD